MIEILEYIKKLDESGNYRLADKLDNEVRKVYAQAIVQSPMTSRQSPGMHENHTINPNYVFEFNEFLKKLQLEKPSTKEETDTLSPKKDADINTIRKQVNKLIADGNIATKNINNIKNDLGALPALEGKTGKVSEQVDQLSTNITNNTNNISDNTQDIQMLQEIVDTLE
jgi:hypothetical protein